MADIDKLEFILVDDDQIFCTVIRLISRNFPERDIFLRTFPNGSEALRFFRANKEYSNKENLVVFVDINMPIMDGWELLEHIQQEGLLDPALTPIYIISSSIRERERTTAASVRILRGILTKPISQKELFNILSK